MDKSKLNLILTWLFLVCAILITCAITQCIYTNYFEFNNNYLWAIFIAHSVAAFHIPFNLLAYYLNKPNLYYHGQTGFIVYLFGCFAIVGNAIYGLVNISGPKLLLDEWNIALLLVTSPLLLLTIPCLVLTSNLNKEYYNNNKQRNVNENFQQQKNYEKSLIMKFASKTETLNHQTLTFIYNILFCSLILSICSLLMSQYWSHMFYTGRIIIICDIIAAVVILFFTLLAGVCRKGVLFLPAAIIGYGLITFINIYMFVDLAFNTYDDLSNFNAWIAFSDAFKWFAFNFIYISAGITGLILTIYCYQESKKNVGRVAAVKEITIPSYPIYFIPILGNQNEKHQQHENFGYY